ncbi:hypothetical protein QYM36_008930, partial [Artemia franciscana]
MQCECFMTGTSTWAYLGFCIYYISRAVVYSFYWDVNLASSVLVPSTIKVNKFI